MQKIGFGIIGCGGIANTHLSSLSKRDDVKILCLADIDEKTVREKAEKYNVEKYVTNYNELLAMKEIDAIIVSLPTYLHRDVVIKTAKVRKHIFCEKPMAMNLSDADEMISVCEQAGILLQVGFVKRFSNQWLKLRELIQEGIIGHPIIWRLANAFSAGASQQWVHNRDKGGGVLVESYMHEFDFTRYVFGEAKRVIATTKRLKPEQTTAIDTVTAIVQFQSGDEFVVSWSWALQGYGFGKSRGTDKADMIGPKGSILFPSYEEKSLVVVTVDKEGKEKQIKYPWRESWWGVTQDSYEAEIVHFVHCIKENKIPKVSGIDGKKALEIALAALESGETGQPVNLKK